MRIQPTAELLTARRLRRHGVVAALLGVGLLTTSCSGKHAPKVVPGPPVPSISKDICGDTQNNVLQRRTSDIYEQQLTNQVQQPLVVLFNSLRANMSHTVTHTYRKDPSGTGTYRGQALIQQRLKNGQLLVLDVQGTNQTFLAPLAELPADGDIFAGILPKGTTLGGKDPIAQLNRVIGTSNRTQRLPSPASIDIGTLPNDAGTISYGYGATGYFGLDASGKDARALCYAPYDVAAAVHAREVEATAISAASAVVGRLATASYTG